MVVIIIIVSFSHLSLFHKEVFILATERVETSHSHENIFLYPKRFFSFKMSYFTTFLFQILQIFFLFNCHEAFLIFSDIYLALLLLSESEE